MKTTIMHIVYYIAIASVLLLRLSLSLTRYFDPDEFAHLHWTWLVANGYQPYRDFFFYILPGFPWLLSPILWLTGDSTNFLIASRVFVFLVYGITATMVYRLSRSSLVATLIFLTFPVTIDKTIDIRPDMVMLALFFGSVLVKNPFVSGILFGASFLVFPKIVFSLPALFYIRLHLAIPQGATVRNWSLGAIVVGLGFLAYLHIHNLTGLFLTSVTRDSVAVTSGKVSFSLLLLLTPYPLIYLTRGGVSLPWVVNTGIWILAPVGLMALWKSDRRMATFWAAFLAGNMLFVALFPVPYVQYFLPLSVAASVLAARARARSITVIKIIIVIAILSSFLLQYRDRTQPGAKNTEQLQVIRDLLTISKPTDTMYDMVGSYVFRPDGYFICCHPYGEFVDRLSAPIQTLRESLIQRQTKFVVMDRVGFVFWQSLPADKAFLQTNYLPTNYYKIYALGAQFRCTNGACMRFRIDDQPADTRSTNTFTVYVPDRYRVSITPTNETMTIDTTVIKDNDTIALSKGTHRFSVAPSVQNFRILLDR